MKAKALVFSQFGKPDEVLRLEELAIGQPGAGEVLVKMLAATINPSDLGTIGGSYGVLPELPAVGGLEGIGEVLEVGGGDDGWKEGDRVRMPADSGVWRSHIVCKGELLEKVPVDIPVEQAAMAAVNPLTAELLVGMLGDGGGWIVQNAANSAVGLAVIQIAKAKRIRTVNLVRREELLEPLLAMGADHVLLDNDDAVKSVRDLGKGYGLPSLGLNAVGGESAYRMSKMLAQGGQHVTYGAMTGEAVRFPTRYLIFDDIRYSGFWVTRWRKATPSDAVTEHEERVYQYFREGVLELPVEKAYRLEEYRTALEHNSQPRLGKVLFKP